MISDVWLILGNVAAGLIGAAALVGGLVLTRRRDREAAQDADDDRTLEGLRVINENLRADVIQLQAERDRLLQRVDALEDKVREIRRDAQRALEQERQRCDEKLGELRAEIRVLDRRLRENGK